MNLNTPATAYAAYCAHMKQVYCSLCSHEAGVLLPVLMRNNNNSSRSMVYSKRMYNCRMCRGSNDGSQQLKVAAAL